MDVSQNIALIDVIVEGNNLSTIDLSNNPALTRMVPRGTNLTTVDLRNGFNTNVPGNRFSVNNTPLLTCIFVDDKVYSEANWTNRDPAINNFVETQAECNATLSVDSFITSEFKLYPNPATSVLHIDANMELSKITIYNLQGQKLSESTSNSVNVESLSNGLYLLEIENTNKDVFTKRFIKQ